MSDKSWEPGMLLKTWKNWNLGNLKTLKTLKIIFGTCWTTFVFMSMLKTYSHTFSLSLSHSHSFSLSHSFNLSFNHSRHAEQLLFSSLCSKVAVYCKNYNEVFWTPSSSSPSPHSSLALILSPQTGVNVFEQMRLPCGGCPQKSIAIFGNKQRLLSIDMKTKVVQHVKCE